MTPIKFYRLAVTLCLFFQAINTTYAQQGSKKLKIDSNTFEKWPALSEPMLSANGGYSSYTINNMPIGSKTLVIKSVKSDWKIKVSTSKSLFLNTKFGLNIAVFNIGKDTLAVCKLGGGIKYYPGYSRAKIMGNNILAVNGNRLMLIQGSQETFFSNVITYDFVMAGKDILIQIDCGGGNQKKQLQLINLESKTRKIILEDFISGDLIYTKNKDKVAYIAKQSVNNDQSSTIVYCDLYFKKFHRIANVKYDDLYISSLSNFNRTEDAILFNLKEKQTAIYKPNSVNLTVWNYKDEISQSQQINNIRASSFLASIPLMTKEIIKIQNVNEGFLYDQRIENWGRFCIGFATKGDCDFMESPWNVACERSYFLVDLTTGGRKRLGKIERKSGYEYKLSPNSTHVVFYDWNLQSYFSYNIKADHLIDITAPINEVFNLETNRLKAKGYNGLMPRGIAGWTQDGKSVLIYDRTDIWSLDLDGKLSPKNLTNGFGKRHDIEFSMPRVRDGIFVYDKKEDVIINGFGLKNKDNGFFKINIAKEKDPENLTMGPYSYYVRSSPSKMGMAPIKAENTNLFVVERSSAVEFPNYYITSDFRSFTDISGIYPEREYEWLKSEIHTYTTVDGELLQGILYKPSNFDKNKKYPIIFNYYEGLSNGLNEYLQPAPLCRGCEINVPIMIGNGYLIFKPDMLYKVNENGKYALQSIESAVKHLSQYKWIDTSRMGIQGCSWGGFLTNYFVTHSKLFKAACTVSGVSDLIGRISQQYQRFYSEFQYGQHNIDKMPWEGEDTFIDNSPLFRANQIQTPLLLMHTTVDAAVPFNQGAQMFLSMRRLRKPAWLLEYGGGANHGLNDPNQEKDFSFRMLQFFNHYLKGDPAPKWIIDGIQAKDAVSNSGLELEKN